MALSDKHEGKILVPWFNSHEWRYVYQLIYSEGSNNVTKKEALAVLKIWKLRMPLLSSGVEGTLIILNALLIDTDTISDENLCLLYATSIMRFLNLCAANSKKQGTFYETARKNNLPDWLINIRHDLAHDQKVPSKFMLLYSLNFCLDWLKREYWDVQNNLVADFIASRPTEEYVDVSPHIKLCCNIISQVSDDDVQTLADLNDDCIRQLKRFIKSNQIDKDTPIAEILQLVCETFMKKINIASRDKIGKGIAEEIINDGILLTLPDLSDASLLWKIFLCSLNDYNMLTPLINVLLNFITDENNDPTAKECASLWLEEIFKSFLQVLDSDIENVGINFSINETILNDLKNVQAKALSDANIYTLVFLETLMKVNRCTEQYINEVLSLVTSYTQVINEDMEVDPIIYTATDVAVVSNEFTTQEQNTNLDISPKSSIQKDEQEEVTAKPKWELVKDTSIFKGCPLGVLPDQLRTRNPLLEFIM